MPLTGKEGWAEKNEAWRSPDFDQITRRTVHKEADMKKKIAQTMTLTKEENQFQQS